MVTVAVQDFVGLIPALVLADNEHIYLYIYRADNER